MVIASKGILLSCPCLKSMGLGCADCAAELELFFWACLSLAVWVLLGWLDAQVCSSVSSMCWRAHGWDCIACVALLHLCWSSRALAVVGVPESTVDSCLIGGAGSPVVACPSALPVRCCWAWWVCWRWTGMSGKALSNAIDVWQVLGLADV